MLNKIKKSSNEGFTIIEVMIVLAIASLILLIVFLAIPALQRSSRNTQRSSDIGKLVTGMGEYISNQNGTIPSASCTGTTPCAWLSNSQTQFYGNGGWTATNYTYTYAATAPNVAAADPANTNNVAVYNYMQCNASNTAAAVASSPRSIAMLYDVETGGGQQEECRTVQ